MIFKETENGLKKGDVVQSPGLNKSLCYLIVKRTLKTVWFKEIRGDGKWSDEVRKSKIYPIEWGQVKN